MRSNCEKSGLFFEVGGEAIDAIRHRCSYEIAIRQKCRNTSFFPGKADWATHTQMFGISLKATGL
jgi:hypothetical protein